MNPTSSKQLHPSTPRPPSAADIAALSLHSLRVELFRRNCSTTGVRHVLERRLHAMLRRAATEPYNAANPAVLTVPPSFPPSSAPPLLQLRRKPCASPPLPPTTPHAAAAPRADHTPATQKPPLAPASTTPQPAISPDLVTPPVRGVLRATSVCVFGDVFATALWRLAGSIGKANLSRSAPTHARPHAVMHMGRALRERLELEAAQSGACANGETAAMEVENACGDGSGGEKTANATGAEDVEHLQLSLVEAYYTAFVRRLLAIYAPDGTALDDAAVVWRLFCGRSRRFAMTFVVYCRYRSAGWVPRSGLKYGVHWVLYEAAGDAIKGGQPQKHRHSPYCVVLRFREDGGQPVRLEKRWTALQTRLRLVKNVNKALVMAEVFAVPGLPPTPSVSMAFAAVRVSEVTVDRWIP